MHVFVSLSFVFITYATVHSSKTVALIRYFRSFKKSFMLDSVNGPSIASILPGGSPAHPLLSLALSYSGGHGRGEEKDGGPVEVSSVRSLLSRNDKSHSVFFSSCLGLFFKVYEAMGIGDVSQIMNIVVNKMCNNIKFWHRSDKILEETLDVLIELVSSYSSSKALLGLDTVTFLVHNHVGAHFPFLGYDSDNKYRITFYTALSRLVFSSSEDVHNLFDVFIAPNTAILAQISQSPDLRTPAIKLAVVGSLRDLRGITTSTYNKRTYNLLFDALYPDAFPLFLRITETWFDDPIVMTAMLKFMQV